jgi:hypothetical protein
MITNPVQSLLAAQNEVAAKAALRQNPAPPPASVPQDRVTISPQAHAQAQQTASSDQNHHGDKK